MIIKSFEVEIEKFTIEAKKNQDVIINAKPFIGKNVLKEENGINVVKLMFSIKNDENNNFPYDIELNIKGEFCLEDIEDDELEKFLNINAIQMLVPYLRSSLSSAMGALMIPPIVLPIMDATKI
ncbi:MAG: protein-export chaperone SecB [Anaeroplasmataceae bacterium]|nr:protein-export chaperone SecB [Anaeroplasmataceae bacterium]